MTQRSFTDARHGIFYPAILKFQSESLLLYKKSLSNTIKHITSYNRCVCGIIINFTLEFSCLLLCVYLPCDNYSNVYINQEYSECIDYIESLYNNSNCNVFICCGDYTTSFERSSKLQGSYGFII